MPGFDKTGPMGTGPIGRGAGPCRGGSSSWGIRGGFRQGRGRGWFGNFFQLSAENDKAVLEEQKSFLQKQLDVINELINKKS